MSASDPKRRTVGVAMRPAARTCAIGLVMAAGLLALPAGASASIVSESAMLTANDQHVHLTPQCPQGQRATGGGWTVEPPFSPSSATRIYESRKVGQRTWRVSAFQISAGAVKHVTAFAYCSNAAPTTERQRTTDFPDVPYAVGSASASCPTGQRAQAGGLKTSPINNLLDTFRVSGGWRTRVWAQAGIGARSVTSYVYCSDEPLPVIRSGAASSATSGDETPATTQGCPPGSHPLTGGFKQPGADPMGAHFDFPFQYRRVGPGWRTSIVHYGTSNTVLTALVYCG